MRNFVTAVAVCAAFTAMPAFAQAAGTLDVADSGDTAWVLVSEIGRAHV